MIRSTQQTLYRLGNLNKQQERISYQLSTNKKLQYGSDDANLYTREIYVDDKIRMYEGIKVQIEKTNAQNNTSDSTLKEAKNLLSYVKAEVIKALNATTDAGAKQAIAVNLKGVKENLLMLSNEQVEGEYLFTGSNSMIKPFEMDASGKVIYHGDAHLRKVAVEDGSYRERGVSGFETFLYTSSLALKGQDLEFSKTSRVIDQDNNEWKLESTGNVTAGNTLTFSANQAVVDQKGTVWTLNDTNTALEDDKGNTLSITDIGGGNYEVTVPADAPAPAKPSTLGVAQLRKYDESGVATSDIKAISKGTDGTLKISLPNIDGTKFEAKSSVFDVMDKIINALEGKDLNGNITSEEEAYDLLGEGLGEISQSFESMNVGHAKLGGRNKVFEISLERVSSKLTQFNILSQEIGAADLSKVAVEAKALELTYTALYSTINKTNELSLVNFIR